MKIDTCYQSILPKILTNTLEISAMLKKILLDTDTSIGIIKKSLFIHLIVKQNEEVINL